MGFESLSLHRRALLSACIPGLAIVSGCTDILDDSGDGTDSEELTDRHLSAKGFSVENVPIQGLSMARDLKQELQSQLPVEQDKLIIHHPADTIMINSDEVAEGEVIGILENSNVDTGSAQAISHDDEKLLESWQLLMENRFEEVEMNNTSIEQLPSDADSDIEIVYSVDQEKLVDELLAVGFADIWIHYPHEENFDIESILTYREISDVGEVNELEVGGFGIPIHIADEAVELFVNSLQAAGFDQPESWGTQACAAPHVPPLSQPPEDGWGHCLGLSVENSKQAAYPVNSNLGQMFVGDNPSFVDHPQIQLLVRERRMSRALRTFLLYGPLPTFLSQ